MKIIILAGGSGTRLWPLSRAYYSKQFLKLKNMDKSIFQMAFERSLKLADLNEIYIVTNKGYIKMCRTFLLTTALWKNLSVLQLYHLTLGGQTWAALMLFMKSLRRMIKVILFLNRSIVTWQKAQLSTTPSPQRALGGSQRDC